MDNNKQKYKLMFDIVRDELNKVDPMNLCPGSLAPIDEYEPETTRIMAALKNVTNTIELSQVVVKVFFIVLGEAFSENYFNSCAQNILDRINELN